MPRARSFRGLSRAARRSSTATTLIYERLRAHAAASPAGRILTFGEHADADVRAERIILKPEGSIIEARLFGKPLTFRVGMPGRHIALNSLGVLAACRALGIDLAGAARALADLTPPSGRGAPHRADCRRRRDHAD